MGTPVVTDRRCFMSAEVEPDADNSVEVMSLDAAEVATLDADYSLEVEPDADNLGEVMSLVWMRAA